VTKKIPAVDPTMKQIPPKARALFLATISDLLERPDGQIEMHCGTREVDDWRTGEKTYEQDGSISITISAPRRPSPAASR
jgi:hypothetical protein